MLGAVLTALIVGGGIAAVVLRRSGGAAEPRTVLEFPVEVVTHSPEFLAREAAQARPAPVAAPAEPPLAQAAAVLAPRVIAIIGNSIAAGGFPGKVRVPGATVRGKGWGGKQAVWIARQAIKEKVVAADLTDVVLEAGVNNVASAVATAVKKGAADPAALAASVARDLARAVELLRAAAPRARIWVLQLPPWRGYTKYFGAGKATAAPMLAVTNEVDAWLAARAGQPGGPDRVIAVAPLADADGRWLPGLSKDDLHPRGPGVDAVAARVSEALIKGASMGGPAVVGTEVFDVTGVVTSWSLEVTVAGALVEAFDAEAASPPPVDVWTVVGLEAGIAFTEPHAPGVYIGADAPLWPPGWRRPSKKALEAVAAASAKYDVPEDYIWAVIRKESNAEPGLRGYRALKSSYGRNRDVAIPGGGGLTWGEKFDEDGWRAYGIMQVLPFNLFGVSGILKAGDPISKAFDVRTNIMAGTRVLRILYDKFGNWEDAVWKYNGSKAYMKEVLAFRETFIAAQRPTA